MYMILINKFSYVINFISLFIIAVDCIILTFKAIIYLNFLALYNYYKMECLGRILLFGAIFTIGLNIMIHPNNYEDE